MEFHNDPYLWLEEINGEKAIEWVQKKNRETQKELETSQFEKLKKSILNILDTDDRIPYVTKSGDYYYNFWQDKDHTRGLWRRTTPKEYSKQKVAWEVLLDLDALAEKESENWVWKGASVLKPDGDRALIELSRGGGDATVTREFDITGRKFVTNGFYRKEAKGSISWIDRNTVFISTDFGEGSLTESGYPRMAKQWQRGEPLEKARMVFAGEENDVWVSAGHVTSPGFEKNLVYRGLDFYSSQLFLLKDTGELVKINVPDSVGKTVSREHLLLELRDDWNVNSRQYPAGSLLLANFDDFMAGHQNVKAIFTPSANTSLAAYFATPDFIFLNVMEDVKSRIYRLSPQDGWKPEKMEGMPALSSIHIYPVDADFGNDYWLISDNYLTPTTLYQGNPKKPLAPVKQLPALYRSEKLEMKQYFATSKDGTKIPYFIVMPKGIKLNGSNPTLLYGYGGFEISLTPSYNPVIGQAWTSKGGIYVEANIRGGGEYGPQWHKAALKQNRLRAYEDFAAVTQDLIQRKITSPGHLGIQGGSNGGLLVGNMMVQYPELFSAAVCEMPLLDMKRYHQLLAGASWMAEYGNPDIPEEWSFIKTFSPYHNVRAQQTYPALLMTTSTRDDRVHPGHARKMTALMESMGHNVRYYENTEGGHGGAANHKQQAYLKALGLTFLRKQLRLNK